MLTNEAWKNSGIIGLAITSIIGGIGTIWKYFVLQSEKRESFFMAEKEKYEKQIKSDAIRIEELHKQILNLLHNLISNLF